MFETIEDLGAYKESVQDWHQRHPKKASGRIPEHLIERRTRKKKPVEGVE